MRIWRCRAERLVWNRLLRILLGWWLSGCSTVTVGWRHASSHLFGSRLVLLIGSLRLSVYWTSVRWPRWSLSALLRWTMLAIRSSGSLHPWRRLSRRASISYRRCPRRRNTIGSIWSSCWLDSFGCWNRWRRSCFERELVAMTFCDIDTIEEIAVELVVEFCVERCVEVVCSRSQDLVWAHWRSLWLSLHNRLCLSILRWRCKVRVPVKIPFFKLDRLDLHSLDFFEILLVVQAIAEYVPECA